MVRSETSLLYFAVRLTLAEYHEQEEIFKLRLGHLKKVRLKSCCSRRLMQTRFKCALSRICSRAGRSRNPSRAGTVGEGEESTHQGAEEDKQ